MPNASEKVHVHQTQCFTGTSLFTYLLQAHPSTCIRMLQDIIQTYGLCHIRWHHFKIKCKSMVTSQICIQQTSHESKAFSNSSVIYWIVLVLIQTACYKGYWNLNLKIPQMAETDWNWPVMVYDKKIAFMEICHCSIWTVSIVFQSTCWFLNSFVSSFCCVSLQTHSHCWPSFEVMTRFQGYQDTRLETRREEGSLVFLQSPLKLSASVSCLMKTEKTTKNCRLFF